MIVVDTNIISYFFLTTKFSKDADNLFKLDPDWAAPLLWKSEFRNVLLAYLKQKILDLNEASKIMNMAETMMAENEFNVVSTEVLELALKSKCSAYDCEFVSLAHSLKVPLITEDKKVLKMFPNNSFSLKQYKKPA